MPVEFAIWRRRLRQVARLAEMRISVIRGVDYVLIEVSDEESRTLTDVIEAHILGGDLSFDDAVRARRRQRLRLAPPLENGNGGGTGSHLRAASDTFSGGVDRV